MILLDSGALPLRNGPCPLSRAEPHAKECPDGASRHPGTFKGSAQLSLRAIRAALAYLWPPLWPPEWPAKRTAARWNCAFAV
jgi:hypothetical protein